MSDYRSEDCGEGQEKLRACEGKGQVNANR